MYLTIGNVDAGAQRIKNYLEEEKNATLSDAEALEVSARCFGYYDYNSALRRMPNAKTMLMDWLENQDSDLKELFSATLDNGGKHIQSYAKLKNLECDGDILIGFYIEKDGSYGNYHEFFDKRFDASIEEEILSFTASRADAMVNWLKENTNGQNPIGGVAVLAWT